MVNFDFEPKLANVLITDTESEPTTYGQLAEGTTDGAALNIKCLTSKITSKPYDMIVFVNLPVKLSKVKPFSTGNETNSDTVTFSHNSLLNGWFVGLLPVDLTDYGVNMKYYRPGATFAVTYTLKTASQVARITADGKKEIISRKLVITPGDDYYVEGPLTSSDGRQFNFYINSAVRFTLNVTIRWNFTLKHLISRINIIRNGYINGAYWELTYGYLNVKFRYYDGSNTYECNWPCILWPSVFNNFKIETWKRDPAYIRLQTNGIKRSTRRVYPTKIQVYSGNVTVGDSDTTVTGTIFVEGASNTSTQKTMTVPIVSETTTFYSEESWGE